MNKKVSDILPKTEILAQLAEEASELAQAALKLRRALDGTNPTPKSVEECRKAFEEEYADVMVCMAALDFSDDKKRMSELELLQAKNTTVSSIAYKTRRIKMAEYHVGCGLFGTIYAGTMMKQRKDGLQLWRTKSDVTDEAVSAVLSHFITEMERSEKTKLEKVWGVIGNKKLKVTFELSTNKERSDE